MLWYTCSTQDIYIQWGNESACFTISIGLCQGGILSPILFSVYMNNLSLILSECGIDCHLDDMCVKLSIRYFMTMIFA